MNITSKSLEMRPSSAPELRLSCTPEKEGVDIKGLNKSDISMKRFNLITSNQLPSVKPTMRRHKLCSSVNCYSCLEKALKTGVKRIVVLLNRIPFLIILFARVICALFFPILAAKKSGCVKYADFFCGCLDLGFILAQLRIRYVLLIFYCNYVT